MIDYRSVFHTGIRVDDLDDAMAQLGPGLGVSWARPREGEQPVWTPDAGEQLVPLRFTYSVDGDQHVELLEGAPGSVWAAGPSPGVHHVGVWVDDVAAETASLVDRGWDLVAAQASPASGFGRFTYVAPPSGLIVELVDAAVRPHFEAWWAGES
jgi:lactoylglutathione lyase